MLDLSTSNLLDVKVAIFTAMVQIFRHKSVKMHRLWYPDYSTSKRRSYNHVENESTLKRQLVINFTKAFVRENYKKDRAVNTKSF